MGIIVKEYTVAGNLRSDTVRVLYDTGAGASFVRRDIAQPLGDFAATASPLRFMLADAQEGFYVDQTVSLIVDGDGTEVMYNFYVADDLAEELIIGADMMQKWKISLDLDNEDIAVDPRALYLNLRA